MRFVESLRRAERWLLPGACLACGEAAGAADPLICPLCQSRWRRLPEPQCDRCGQPSLLDGDPCRFCAGWPEALVWARSAVWLDEGARRAVHALKYGGWGRVAEPLAGAMRRLIAADPDGTLVPVPLSAARARRRGYNQAERLARALAAAGGWRVAPGLLIRARHTSTQTALSPEERRANIAAAFSAPGPVAGRVILVDDVLTTGATLAEAALTLAKAGANSVEAVTFARAMPPLG